MKFRPVRETFEESIFEEKDLLCIFDLFEIAKKLKLKNTDTVTFEYQCYDDRWQNDSYLVIIDNKPIGYVNGVLS